MLKIKNPDENWREVTSRVGCGLWMVVCMESDDDDDDDDQIDQQQEEKKKWAQQGGGANGRIRHGDVWMDEEACGPL